MIVSHCGRHICILQLDEILSERKRELKQEHHDQMDALRKAHEEQLKAMQEEFKAKVNA